MYKVGDKVLVRDNINPDMYPSEEGTVVFVEPDSVFSNGLSNDPDILWVYIKADDASLNKEIDPRFGNYWIVRESTNEHLFLK